MALPASVSFRRPAVRMLLLAALLLCADLLAGPAFEALRGKSYDLYQRLIPIPPDTSGIVLVEIDDAALAREGRWPWPRSRIAALVAAVGATRPKVFGVDILFPDEGPRPEDAALATVLGESKPVLAMSLVDQAGSTVPQPPAGWSVVGNAPETLASFSGLLVSRDQFTAEAGGMGVVRSVTDPDGVTRSVPTVWAVSQGEGLIFWPSFALELARVAQQESGFTLRLSREGYDAVRVGERIVPLTAGGAIWLTDSIAPIERVGALEVMAGGVGERLEGRIVILSVAATGFDTFHTTSLVATRPGAEIHALLTAQILNGRFPAVPLRAGLYERAAFAVLSGAMIAALTLLAGQRLMQLAAVLVVLVLPLTAGLAAYYLGDELYDTLRPTIGLATLAAGGAYFLYRAAEARRRLISSQFARYLSPRVVERLIRSEAEVTRSAERREVTVLFMDMRGFTAASEALPPGEIVETVNRFLTIASAQIFRTDGTIDKFMGDAVMAFWNAPLDQPDHAERALAAVRAIFAAIDVGNEGRRRAGRMPILLGAGIETGPCSVGNFGSDIRYNFTVIGHAANLASRLESATKHSGIRALGGPVFAAKVGAAARPAGRFALAGFPAPVEAFEILLEG